MSILLQGPTHPGYIDDEIAALTLQLDEINYREETQKAKYSSDDVPDLEIAYANYLSEIAAHLAFLKDMKLAHSFANAIDTDGPAIANIAQGETQAQEDRRLALRMSSDDPELEAPPPYTEEVREEFIEDEVMRRLNSIHISNDDLYADPEVKAGPSVPYAQRQADALAILGRQAFECIGCSARFRLADTSQLGCNHRYCKTCLKQFIMQGVVDHDLAYIPPRCCGEAVSRAIITTLLTAEEMDDFENAETEKITRDKTYCSSPTCGRFIAPQFIVAGEATCPRCDARTCAMCKNPQHKDDCPADPDLQAILNLGNDMRWRRCFSCRTLVELDRGCNHMTCRCGAEFCYQCGTEWANPRRCGCDFWIENNLVHRAGQVVDRAAPAHLPAAERMRRVVEVQEQLRYTDDCEHRGRKKFEQITGGRRTRFQCEMCNVTHKKFILRCRRCQLDVCMDCRLHRV